MIFRAPQLGQTARLWAAACTLAVAALGTSPTPLRAADTPSGSRDVIRKALTDLDCDRSQVRQAAYRRLIKLSPDDLPTLREAVAQHPSTYADREELLHNIVIQLFSSGLTYPPDADNHGFLGVSFDPEQTYEVCPYPGVEIRHIVTGLAASKYLEEGDIVLSIAREATAIDIEGVQEMITVIQSFHAGETATLTILRQGRHETIDVVLSPAPRGILINRAPFDEAVANRQTEAETYWQEQFEPLFNPPPATRAAFSP